MKAWEIADSEDHITDQAIANSAAKWIEPGAVLVVVRGMILVRTFPVAIARVSLTINQDMKALVPKDGVISEYLAYMLRASEREVLSRVQTASHGTRRLQTEALMSLDIPVPSLEEQERIVKKIDTARANLGSIREELAATTDLLNRVFSSLLDTAQRGEL